ncbi:unnamed protein product [Miscanthus lutarioriparius]|uniref:Uncharacterized protein n=1 Tax=Miscanthus lutarioriparius TaxID=422564 RepID=A0A811S8Y5_9POAL|nr:unnamed protein product [Miscanthus lutarioriparius]
MATTRGKVEERGDGDVGELPSRWGVQPLGLRHMYLPGYGDTVVWSYRGVVALGLRGRRGDVIVSPSRLHGGLGKASGGRSWRPQGVSG